MLIWEKAGKHRHREEPSKVTAIRAKTAKLGFEPNLPGSKPRALPIKSYVLKEADRCLLSPTPVLPPLHGTGRGWGGGVSADRHSDLP